MATTENVGAAADLATERDHRPPDPGANGAAAVTAPIHVLLAVRDVDRGGALAAAVLARELVPTLAGNGGQLVDCCRHLTFDLVVAEDSLFDDGDEPLRDLLGRHGNPPVFLLGREALPSPERRAQHVVACLDAGASPSKVAAAVAGAVGPEVRSRAGEILQWGPLGLDVRRREATWRGAELAVTPTQWRILTALTRARGAVLSSLDLQREVWGALAIDDRERLAAHVRRIRAKIEDDPSTPRFLLTARGEGFRLCPADEAEALRDPAAARDGDGAEGGDGEHPPTFSIRRTVDLRALEVPVLRPVDDDFLPRGGVASPA